jgi:hypothetical protein
MYANPLAGEMAQACSAPKEVSRTVALQLEILSKVTAELDQAIGELQDCISPILADEPPQVAPNPGVCYPAYRSRVASEVAKLRDSIALCRDRVRGLIPRIDV